MREKCQKAILMLNNSPCYCCKRKIKKPPVVNYFYPNRIWRLKWKLKCLQDIPNKQWRYRKFWRDKNGFVSVNETEGGRVWKWSIWQHKAIELRERFCHISRAVRICCSYLTLTQHNVKRLQLRRSLRHLILFHTIGSTTNCNCTRLLVLQCTVLHLWHINSINGFPSIYLANALS